MEKTTWPPSELEKLDVSLLHRLLRDASEDKFELRYSAHDLARFGRLLDVEGQGHHGSYETKQISLALSKLPNSGHWDTMDLVRQIDRHLPVGFRDTVDEAIPGSLSNKISQRTMEHTREIM